MIEFFGLLRFKASSPSDPSKIEANATGASEMCEACLWKFMEMMVRFFPTSTVMVVKWAKERDFLSVLLPADQNTTTISVTQPALNKSFIQ